MEDQQAEAAQAPAVGEKVKPRGNIHVDAEKKRQMQALEMQRERVLSERTSSPHRRTALEDALNRIEEKLTELGWEIHL